ncbi:MAG: nitroreductase family protein [Spirochaetaceae bacterium]|nr:nitroreductase family protein [Spirochaetaceae bacterium]
MKKSFLPVFVLAALLFAPGGLEAQELNQAAYDNIITHYAARNNFISGTISRGDIEKILVAGLRAPSASNRQPWHFTVVQNSALAGRIVSGMPDGNILIVVSSSGDGRTNGPAILDCGLATESIYLAAQALGYGSRIYTGPMNTVNSQFKAELGLPAGHNAVALVRVGRVQKIDAASAASARKSLGDIVTYK